MRKVNLRKKLHKNEYFAIMQCVDIADASGFKIYLVGGIVRDILLNKSIRDIDVMVEGSAKNFVEVLCRNIKIKKVKYNEKLPTAKVIFLNGVEIDFASTRKEVYNKSGLLPEIIKTGCSINEDNLRRDFTVNSLIMSLNKANLFEIIDFSTGVEDLKNKKLRVLHNKSFYDDPSRMIRGLKFAERLGFSLDENTLSLQNKYLAKPLKNIPLERVKNELKDLFSLNQKSCFDNFIKQGLYKIFLSNFSGNINGNIIKNVIFDFDIQEQDYRLLYFLPLFQNSEPPKKLNLTVRELGIIKDIQNFSKEKKVFDDNYSIYEYFINKDYLSVVFYGMLHNLKIAKKFFKIRNTKIFITGKDLIEMGIPCGEIYSEIQKVLLQKKLNNELKTKEEEKNFVKTNFLNLQENK